MVGPKINGKSEWVVVCDGTKALVLENSGSLIQPRLSTKEVREQEPAKTSEIGTDRPGRTFQSVGAKRSAMEETDLKDQSEQRFLVELADRLNRAVTAGEIQSLVVVAPPRALGVLRGSYTPNVRQAVREEIDKDLVMMPVPEIEKQLAR